MSRYTIRVEYQTGNSFHRERTTDEVGLNWESLAKAKLALQCIGEHYAAYQREDNDFRYSWQATPEAKEAFFTEVRSKPWYRDEEFIGWHSGLLVEKDDGEMQGIQAFWTGHFERLYAAEVILLDPVESGLRIEF